jgi:hypothetical protein
MVAPLFKRELAPRAPSGADARFERAVQRLDRISLLVGGPRGPQSFEGCPPHGCDIGQGRTVRPMPARRLWSASFQT